jgi:hypothetical protein
MESIAFLMRYVFNIIGKFSNIYYSHLWENIRKINKWSDKYG